MYYVYLLCCADRTLYTGLAKDVERRLQEHQNSPKGARYTRSRRPVELLAVSPPLPDRRAAARLEYALKKKTRTQKLSWVNNLATDTSAFIASDVLRRLLGIDD